MSVTDRDVMEVLMIVAVILMLGWFIIESSH